MFDAFENFWILPNLILRMSWVFKNVNFEQNFWHESKFLDFAKFHPSKVRNGQTLDFKPNFQRDWKFLDFAKFSPRGGGGALPLWRWCRCKAPKTALFSVLLSPNDPYFCWLSLLSPKDPTFFGEMWALRSLSPKDPLFLAFGCHKKLLFVLISSTNWSFLPFSTVFSSNSCF